MPALGTSLNNAPPNSSGEYSPGGTGTIRKTLAFNAAVASAVDQVIGVLPAGAAILSGGIWVNTAFNGTTPTLNIGYAADSLGAAVPAAYASALALPATTTFVPLDENTTVTAKPRALATTLTANITYTTTTAGSCDIIITYAAGG
jgi:hypothetical protein